MDLRAYYKKIRDVESSIAAPYVVVVGLETPDGGKAGTLAEVSRSVGARLVAESRARLASETESQEYDQTRAEARREAEALAASQRMQVTIVPSSEYRGRASRPSKD